MRATFITTALENGGQLEDVQKAAGHRDPGTTKLYDRRGYNPEKRPRAFSLRINVHAQTGSPPSMATCRSVPMWQRPQVRRMLFAGW
jgi:hypothetical protein